MEKIVHSYGRTIFTLQSAEKQIFVNAQNPYELRTNSVRIVLFLKKWQKVRKRR